MRQRFWLLLLATVLVVAGAVWLAKPKGANSESRSELWLPGLRGDLDRITAVRFIGADNKRLVTIERDPAGFVVVERDGYRADTAILRTLLLQLADARRVEAKTARAEHHVALGVESVASAKATGVRVEIAGPARPISFTVGRTADQLGGGTFVRMGDDLQAWLVSGNLVIEREPQRWLEKRIADIPPARIERIEVQAGGESFALVREKAGPEGQSNAAESDEAPLNAAADAANAPVDSTSDSFLIEGVAAADMASPYATVATASALAELDLLDVRSRKQAPVPANGSSRMRYVLRNGISVIATTWLEDGKTLLQLHAIATPGAEEPGAAASAPRTTPPVAQSDGDSAIATPPRASGAGGNAKATATAKAATSAVAAFNRHWQNWTYVLPPHRSAGMTPTRTALLKPDNES